MILFQQDKRFNTFTHKGHVILYYVFHKNKGTWNIKMASDVLQATEIIQKLLNIVKR